MTVLAALISPEDLIAGSRQLPDGRREAVLALPSIHCGGCVARIEKGIAHISGITSVRVNLTSKRMTVQWSGENPPAILDTLRSMGHEPSFIGREEEKKDKVRSSLVKALAVSGFGASNIMILSVAVWSGVDTDTRTLFHCLSALIALPVIAYSGRVFFNSAFRALRRFETNMDVPISLGIILACVLSIYDTLHDGTYAYFDAAVSLIFFLLIGRTLDHMMRVKASTAVGNLASLFGHSATVERDGVCHAMPLSEVRAGMTLLIAAGQRIPVDAIVLEGISDIDGSLVSGETVPFSVCPGAVLRSGLLNLSAPLKIRAVTGAANSFLAEMTALMEGAGAGKSRYQRIADRASRIYTPVAHLAAFLTFSGWIYATGNFHAAASAAITALIITCPCALGLAAPMVQVIASKNLFSRGIVVKNGEALERLHDADKVIFDKTGTLTLSQPVLAAPESYSPAHLALARQMAVYSRHPYCRALVADAPEIESKDRTSIREIPGAGLEMQRSGSIYRLGRQGWAGVLPAEHDQGGICVLSRDNEVLETFAFAERLRDDAVQTLSRLEQSGLGVEILSGDTTQAVHTLSRQLGVSAFTGSMTPRQKMERLNELSSAGQKVVMVGDGLNDLPALAGAHVSFAPSGANDVSQKAADFVLLDGNLGGILYARRVAILSHRFILQNFGLAAVYNLMALPFAMAGLVTPLLAALAMSASSIIVVANALRLSRLLSRPESGVT